MDDHSDSNATMLLSLPPQLMNKSASNSGSGYLLGDISKGNRTPRSLFTEFVDADIVADTNIGMQMASTQGKQDAEVEKAVCHNYQEESGLDVEVDDDDQIVDEKHVLENRIPTIKIEASADVTNPAQINGLSTGNDTDKTYMLSIQKVPLDKHKGNMIASFNELGMQSSENTLSNNNINNSSDQQLTSIVDLAVLQSGIASPMTTSVAVANQLGTTGGASNAVPIRKRVPVITNDHQMNQALGVLIHKTSEQRGPEDIDILQKAVRLFPFFMKIEQKVLLMQNLVKAMQYQYVPKGKVVFYQGDIPDRFFITLKGKVCILVPKKPQDIQNEELLQGSQWSQLSKEKQKLTIQKRFLYRSLHRAFKRLCNYMYFLTLIKVRQMITAERKEGGGSSGGVYESHRVSIIVYQQEKEKVVASSSKDMTASEFEEEFERMLGQHKDQLKLQNEHFKKAQEFMSGRQYQQQQSLFGNDKRDDYMYGISKVESNTAIELPSMSVISTQNIQLPPGSKSTRQIQFAADMIQESSVSKQQSQSSLQKPSTVIYKPIQPAQSYVKTIETMANKMTESAMNKIQINNNSLSHNNSMYNAQQLQNSGLFNFGSNRRIMQQESDMISSEVDDRVSSPLRKEPASMQWMKMEIARLQRGESMVSEQEYIQSRDVALSAIQLMNNNKTSTSLFADDKKDVQNVGIAKRLQFASSSVLQQRKKLKTAIDLFVDQSNISTFKLYSQYKQQIEKKVPGLDLESLENGSHFFSNNVFKYNHAMSSGDGYVFGELGILNKKPRSATVVCLEDCYFGTLPLKKYEQILMKQEKASLVKKRVFIMETLTAGSSDEVSIEKMSKISYYFHKRKYQAGEVVFREGDAVKFIYLIKKGEVELEKVQEVVVNPNEMFKTTVRVAKLASREYFGDCDIHFDRPRFFTAVATTVTTIYYCDKHQFLKCAEETKSFIERFGSNIEKKHNYRLGVIADAKNARNFIKHLDSLDLKSFSRQVKRNAKAASFQSTGLTETPSLATPIAVSLSSGTIPTPNTTTVMSSSTLNHTMPQPPANQHQQLLTKQSSELLSTTTTKAPAAAATLEQAMMTKSSFYSPRIPFQSSQKKLLHEEDFDVEEPISSLSPLRKTSSQASLLLHHHPNAQHSQTLSHFRNLSITKQTNSTATHRMRKLSLKDPTLSTKHMTTASLMVAGETQANLQSQLKQQQQQPLYSINATTAVVPATTTERMRHAGWKSSQQQYRHPYDTHNSNEESKNKKSFREEYFSSAERIQRLKSDIKANASLMRERSKKTIPLTPHESFLQMRVICTLNNKLFQREEKVFEKRQEVQKLLSETKNTRHFHSPQRLDTLRDQLDQLRSGSRPLFFESFFSSTKKNGNNANPMTATNNNGISRKQQLTDRLVNYGKEKAAFAAAEDMVDSPVGTGVSLLQYKNRPDSNSNSFSQLMKKKRENSTHSPSQQIKTSSLFLFSEHEQVTKSIDNLHKHTPGTTPIAAAAAAAVEHQGGDVIQKVFPIFGESAKDMIHEGVSHHGSSSVSLKVKTSPKPSIAAAAATTAASTMFLRTATSMKVSEQVQVESSSTTAAASSTPGKQLKFDDNHVEKIEPKRFDMKKHYISTKKITVLNHMQKPMLFKQP